MKNARIIILIIVIAVAAYYGRIYLAANNLTFGAGSASKLRFQKGFVSWEQIINVTNGESVAIPITSANVQPVFNKTAIGKTILKGSQTIAARNTTGLIFTVVIPYTDFISIGFSIQDILKDKNLTIELQGSVRAVGLNVPLKESYFIDLKNISS